MKENLSNFFNTKSKMNVLLFCYHFLFILMAYYTRVKRGMSDAHLYWGKKFDILHNSWLDFANYGTDFMLFLNYPFVKMGVPFLVGFLIYGIIGFFGILKWKQWTELVFGDSFLLKGYNVLPLIFFLPNLHVWTASLGKESLVFWGIATVFYAFTVQKYMTWQFFIGAFFIIVIRPHVALMLFSALALVLLFDKNKSLKNRVYFGFLAVVITLFFAYLAFQLSKIRYWNWARIQKYNHHSLISFKTSGSYVPMEDYNLGYKLFSFNFRPLFFDAHSFWQIMASAENGFMLCIVLLVLFYGVKFYSKISFPNWLLFAFAFAVISSLLYVQRYANLGIFMRTKMLFQPFLLVGLLYICKKGMDLNTSKS